MPKPRARCSSDRPVSVLAAWRADAMSRALNRESRSPSTGPFPQFPEAGKAVRFDGISCKELDQAKYETTYLIEKTLVAGQPCVIAGDMKTLKTSLAVDMSISLATSGAFLRELNVERPVRVGMMSGEGGLATIQERARRIAKAAGYRLADIDQLIFSEKLPQFASRQHMDALGEFVERHGLEVLVIDPVYLCMPGRDAGNLFIQGEHLQRVNEVCLQNGCTMVLVHHTHRGGNTTRRPPELQDIAWAGFPEWARQWILVGRREKYHPGTGDHKLWLNVGGSAGHSALWVADIFEGASDGTSQRCWEVTLTTPEEERREADRRREEAKAGGRRATLEADKKKILEVLADFPEGETETVLRDRARMSGARFRAAIDELLAEGSVEKCGVSKPNRRKPYPGYRASQTP